MNTEAIKIQTLFQRYRQLWYPASITVLLIGLNLFIYYGLLLPGERSFIAQEQAWKNAREQFSRMLQYQKAQEDLEQFRKLLLTKNEFAKRVVNHLSDTAKRLNLSLPDVSYKPDETQEGRLTKMNFSFTISGSYEALRRFIYAIETSSDFLIIEDLDLVLQAKKGTRLLELQLKLATYLK
jgi:Tfp pilus assembly protein PilO